MSLTDGPLWVAPILALQALNEAGVKLTAHVEPAKDAYSQDSITVEAVWRAEVRRHLGESASMTIPVILTAQAATLEEAAEKVLEQIKRITASTEAAASRVAGTPARAW